MPLPICLRRCSNCALNLYIIGVIVARVWGDYYLSNFVIFLDGPADYTPALASAIINAKDGFAGICGVFGAILFDVYLTSYGMIFLSALIYGVGFLCIIWGMTDILSPRFTVAIIGLFMSGAGNLTLMNSANTLAKEKKDSNQSNTNLLTNFIKFIFGDDTDIYRLVQARESVIVLVVIKYITKVMFIVVSMVLDYLTEIYPRLEDYGEYVDFAHLLIPTVGLVLMALISLVYVKSFVKPAEERRTPLKHVLHVCITAFSNRHLHCPQNLSAEMLHEDRPDQYALEHTNGFRFLDKAAIIPSSQPEEGERKRKLCTITEVEETKCLLRMVPMCLTFLLYGLVNSVGTTFFLIQGNEMYSLITIRKKFVVIPLQTLILIGEISGLLTKGLYVILISKRLTGPGKRYAPPIKYVIGIVLATFCSTVASWTAADKGSVNMIFWLTPQFLLFGAMKEVTRDGIQNFFHDQLPPTMKRYASVFCDAIIGVGAGLCAALVYATHSRIDQDDDDPFKSFDHFKPLSIFYRQLTVVCFVILSAYTFVATRYRYRENKEAQSNPIINMQTNLPSQGA